MKHCNIFMMWLLDVWFCFTDLVLPLHAFHSSYFWPIRFVPKWNMEIKLMEWQFNFYFTRYKPNRSNLWLPSTGCPSKLNRTPLLLYGLLSISFGTLCTLRPQRQKPGGAHHGLHSVRSILIDGGSHTPWKGAALPIHSRRVGLWSPSWRTYFPSITTGK